MRISIIETDDGFANFEKWGQYIDKVTVNGEEVMAVTADEVAGWADVHKPYQSHEGISQLDRTYRVRGVVKIHWKAEAP